jgi:hypothetical protein
MATRTADPKTSAGARLERKACREYLRRLFTRTQSDDVQQALAWVLKREKRYDRRPGGL